MTEINSESGIDLERDVPGRGIAKWAAFKHFARINEVLGTLTPLGWSVHHDPQRPGTCYIAGAPETAVVAEGLTIEDANNIVFLVNEMPEAVEHFEELARLWDVLVEGAPENFQEITDYLDTIIDYQVKIAQLEENPSPVPPVAVAEDLNYMHIGHFLVTPDGEGAHMPILSATQRGNKVVVRLGDGDKTVTYVLNKDEPVNIVISYRLQDSGIQEEEVTEVPVSSVE